MAVLERKVVRGGTLSRGITWLLPVWLAPFLLLSPLLLSGKAMFWGTPSLQFVPWWHLAAQLIQSGQLPLWNPMNGMGAPLLANYQSALLYPPNWLYILLDWWGGVPLLAWGQALLVAVHLAWAGTGMALLVRRLGLAPLAQTVSGLAFGLSGYLVSRAGFLSINATAAWLPWVILALTHLLLAMKSGNGSKHGWVPARSAWGAWFGLVVVLAMQLLAGHAQTTWYTWLLAMFWAGYWGWKLTQDPLKQERSGKVKRLREISLRVAQHWSWLGAAILAACALAAIQLIPTAEYLIQSQRAAAAGYDFVMNYSFWPWRLLGLVAPDLFGSPVRGDFWGFATYWEDALYIGLLPFSLAVYALSRRKGTPLIVLILLSVLLALGRNTPVFPWLYRHVPTFDMFQAPARFLIWAEFSLAILAGYGAHAWRRPTGRALYWTRLGLMAGVAVTLGAGLTGYLLPDIVRPTFIRATALAGLWGIGAILLSLTAPDSQEKSEKSEQPGKEHSSPDLWQVAVLALVISDLVVADWGLVPGEKVSLYQELPNLPPALENLTNEQRLFLAEPDERYLKYERFFRFESFLSEEPWDHLRAALLPNSNLFDGFSSANNYDPLVPGRYARWMETFASANGMIRERMLNLMAVGVVEEVDLRANAGVRFRSIQPQISSSVPVAASRVRWLPCAVQVSGEEDAWRMVFRSNTDLANRVVVEGSFPVKEACRSGKGQAILTGTSANRLEVTVSGDQPGWLLLSDVGYPGWRVAVDGTKASLYQGDYLFRAVSVPAGKHQVVFTYQPVSFWLGLWVSLIAWILLFVGVFWKKNR